MVMNSEVIANGSCTKNLLRKPGRDSLKAGNALDLVDAHNALVDLVLQLKEKCKLNGIV